MISFCVDSHCLVLQRQKLPVLTGSYAAIYNWYGVVFFQVEEPSTKHLGDALAQSQFDVIILSLDQRKDKSLDDV